MLAALIVSLVAAATAWADGTISARPVNSFSSSVTTIDQGEKVTFRNTDVAGHDVVSEKAGDDSKPLFRSEIVAPGASGPVRRDRVPDDGHLPVLLQHPSGDGGDARGDVRRARPCRDRSPA